VEEGPHQHEGYYNERTAQGVMSVEKPARRRQDGVAEEVELQPRKRNSKMRRMYTLLTK
jgi:hypothetical protein